MAFSNPGRGEVVDAKTYLTKPEYGDVRGAKVFNLCRSYRYQSLGYYVTLLATARGHKPLPNIMTIQDMKSQTVVRFVSDDLDDLIQHSLAPIEIDKFTLSIYFGRNLARRYDRLACTCSTCFRLRCCGRNSRKMASGSCGRSAQCRWTAFRRSIARSCWRWRPSTLPAAARRRASGTGQVRPGDAGESRRAIAAVGRKGHRSLCPRGRSRTACKPT